MMIHLSIPFNLNGYVFFGYPNKGMTLVKGDIIVLNLPRNIDGRFIKSEELGQLTSFLNSNVFDSIRIQINVCWGSNTFNNEYSEALKKDLIKIFSEEISEKKYNIVSNGCECPIFDNKDSIELFRFINSRLELIIE